MKKKKGSELVTKYHRLKMISEVGGVDLSLEKDRIVIRKQEQSLEALLSQVSDQNIHREIDTGQVIDKELW